MSQAAGISLELADAGRTNAASWSNRNGNSRGGGLLLLPAMLAIGIFGIVRSSSS
jgi:hypothetical protein